MTTPALPPAKTCPRSPHCACARTAFCVYTAAAPLKKLIDLARPCGGVSGNDGPA